MSDATLLRNAKNGKLEEIRKAYHVLKINSFFTVSEQHRMDLKIERLVKRLQNFEESTK